MPKVYSKYFDQEHMRDNLFKIPKHSTLQEADETEPEPKARTTVSKLAEGLGLIETGIKVFQDIDSKKTASNT
jgi:hypothetical protein